MGLYHLWSLVKPRIVALLSLTGTTALIAAGGTTLTATVGFVLAGACIAGGSAALNCVYDRDIDPLMERTADRPLATGDLSPETATAFAVAVLATGTVIGLATLPPIAVAYMWAGVVAYVGLYTMLLKRRTRLGVVLGGSAGAFPVLAGWRVVRPLSLEAVLFAGLVFAWTPAHAWALAYVYRDDFAGVSVPTLPAVTTPAAATRRIWQAALLTVGVAIAFTVVTGPVYAAGVLTGTPLFVWAYHRFRRVRTDATAVRAFFTSNTYLAMLFIAWAVGATSTHIVTVIAVAVLTPATILGLWWRRPRLRGVPTPPLPTIVTPPWIDRVRPWPRAEVPADTHAPTRGDRDE